MKKKISKIIPVFLAVLVSLSIFSACSDGTGKNIYQSNFDLNGKNVGTTTGTIYIPIVKELLPDSNVDYYQTAQDGLNALAMGKIEAFVTNDCVLKQAQFEIPNLTHINEYITDNNYAFCFQKSDERSSRLRNEFNEFISRKLDDGYIDELQRKWINGDASHPGETADYRTLPDINGKITVATCSSQVPFDYIYNNRFVGFEVELLTEFCSEKGYSLEFRDMQYDAIIPYVQSGKADIGASDIVITDERAEAVDFSVSYYNAHGVFVIRTENSVLGRTSERYNSIEDFETAAIGTQTGTIFGSELPKILPNATIKYYDSVTDMVSALETNKIQGLTNDYYMSKMMINENPAMYNAAESDTMVSQGFILPKSSEDSELYTRLNEFINEIHSDGTTDRLIDIWTGTNDAEKTITAQPDPSGELLNISICSTTGPPYMYVKNGEYVGLEIDILTRFAEKYHYNINFIDSNFTGLIAGVSSGKYDIGASCITITDERKQSVLFTDAVFESPVSITSYDSEYIDFRTVPHYIRESFEKTFIREDRWQLFVYGIIVTMIITVVSVIGGTALGYGFYMTQRKGNRVADVLCRFFCWLINGMPVVVLLMILFYIIFGSVSVDGIIISAIGFTLIFTANMIANLKMGVGAVDRGQKEGAYALGYSDRQTFRKIILPQAKYHFMPSYRENIVSLLKATSVVGYIAVQDLTKISDIIRSRTYEPFFPLIATAILYFIIAAVIIYVVRKININSDPKNRPESKILRGIHK